MKDDPRLLVSTEWLHDNLANVRVLDASWYLPAMQRDARAEHAAAHIPGARFFDIDEIADLSSGLPHMLPDAIKFASRVRTLGIGNQHQVVVYDGAGLFSAARVWWMFRVFGHDAVAVLDGGLPKWQAEGRDVTATTTPALQGHFHAHLRSALVADVATILHRDSHVQLLDARGSGRFRGREPEPRPGVRPGHIPGALNLPFAELLNPDGTLKDAEALAAAFAGAGIDTTRPVITSCGSGVTAAILNLGLARIGAADAALYDGSWAEWGSRTDLEIATQ